MKRCSKCQTQKPATNEYFPRAPANPDGWHYHCKACLNAANAVRRDKRRAKNLAARVGEAGEVPEFDITVEEPAPTVDTKRDVYTDVPAPDPLTAAYQERTERKEKADTKRQRDALLQENDRLRAENAALRDFRQAPEILIYKQPAHERADAIACAVASDWHIEEPVEVDTVHGLNAYNLDIAKSRAEHFFQNLLRLTDIMARDSKITTIHISALGDFFSGWIHEELIAGGLLAPGDAARFCKGLWFSGIDFLLRESSYVIQGDMIPGNHGRMTKQMHFGDPTGTSLESVMYESIVDRYYDNARVQLKVASQAMVYRKFFERFTLRQIHGYEVKYGGGVGGITIPLRKALAQWNNPIRADLTVLGHFHQFFDGGDFLVNGSLIGYNLFAQAIKASFEEARQAFYLVHARNGGTKSVTAPIWLDKAHHAQEAA